MKTGISRLYEAIQCTMWSNMTKIEVIPKKDIESPPKQEDEKQKEEGYSYLP